MKTQLTLLAALTLCAGARADVVTDWNEVALARSTAARQLPPDGSRAMAMVHVAMFDAINAVQPRYTPYAFKGKAPAGASADAAGVAAARTVLLKLYPDQRDAIEKAYAASLASIPAGAARDTGIALGEQVGAQCIAMREKDGAGASFAYRPTASPGVYVPTMVPVSAEWPQVKPFFMKEPAQFRPAPPPALKSAEWAKDLNEIQRIGGRQSSARTQEQTDIGRFWALTGVPSWNPIVRSLSSSAKLDLVDNARLFALVNMAATDSFISVFDAKYAYNLWRPITAIRNGDQHGNGEIAREAAWLPLIDTPMHPEYPCAHCISSSAVGTVLASVLRDRPISVSMTSPTAPGVTRKWESIEDYMQEVNDARVYAGVHYRFSTRVGADMGRKIGELAVQDYMKPL
ncbi:MAG TPA: vanadium-dependent haloperoxidase [Burkholderiales bacterium]|nr:vanadium-dependent haloperoxidase [Burkholderiales bacterium]